MENKNKGIKNKLRTAFKSFAGRKKSSKSNELASSSLSPIPVDVETNNPQASSQQLDVDVAQQAADANSIESQPKSPPSAPEVARPASSTAKGNEGAGQSSDLSLFPAQKTSRYVSELNEAIREFKKNYVRFSKANSEYILIDDELENVMPDIATVGDLKQIAQTFHQNVTKTIRIKERKKSVTESHWLNQVGHFLTKLYPVAKLSCSLMGAVVEVIRYDLVAINV
jgi:hypothetical protein